MKIYCIGVFSIVTLSAEFLDIVYDVSNFNYFLQGTVSEYLKFTSRTIAESTKPNTKTTVVLNEEKFKINMCGYSFFTSTGSTGCTGGAGGIGCVVIASEDYPSSLVYRLMLKEIRRDSRDSDKINIKEWQLVPSIDKITKVQQEIAETKEIMYKNLESIIARGETLDSLVAKSKDLSINAKAFYHKAKKTNQCCKWY
jgi:synaptobrevin family protein YKT6